MLAALALREFETLRHASRREEERARGHRARRARLGNTPTICRKCYVHPEVLHAYLEGATAARDQGARVEEELREDLARFKPEEAAVLAMLEARLKRTLAGALKDRLAASKR